MEQWSNSEPTPAGPVGVQDTACVYQEQQSGRQTDAFTDSGAIIKRSTHDHRFTKVQALPSPSRIYLFLAAIAAIVVGSTLKNHFRFCSLMVYDSSISPSDSKHPSGNPAIDVQDSSKARLSALQ